MDDNKDTSSIFMHLFTRFQYFLHTHIDLQKLEATIADNARLSPTYLFLLTSATILATLGLLLNSPAVIIGAMVIAPFTWPILRIAHAVAKADSRTLFKGIRLLTISIVLMLGIAFVLTKILPLTVLTDQITSRTAPTILDLIIALVAGAIVTLALFNNKISQTGAGVAIAASLLPPMCVGGIGLALGVPSIAWGGIVLSVTNIIAILFAATLILITLIRTSATTHLIRRLGIFTISLLVLCISIPLLFLFSQYVENTIHPDEHAQVETILLQQMPGSFIQTVQIAPNTITAVILIPKGIYIPPTIGQNAQEAVDTSLKKNYQLNLHFIQELSVH